MLRLDKGRVLDDAPWELREGIAELGDALHLHSEATLLRHRGVKATCDSAFLEFETGDHQHVVRGEQKCVEGDVSRGAKPILGRVMLGHVDDRVAVGLWRRCQATAHIAHGEALTNGTPRNRISYVLQRYGRHTSKVPENDHKAPSIIQ